MRNLYILVIIFAFFTGCEPSGRQASDSVPEVLSLTQEEIDGGVMTPEILWKFGRISDHQLSPEGQTVIYSVTRYNYKTNKSISEIYSVSSSGGDVSRLLGTLESCSNIRWNPDGTKIGYICSGADEPQIWEMDPDGENKKQVSFINGGVNGFEYSPAGDQIFYLQDVKLDPTPNEIYEDLPLANVRIIDDLMYRHWNRWHDYKYSHIFITSRDDDGYYDGMDIMEGEKWDSPLSPYFDQSEISWSPDGKYVAYTCKKMKGKEYALSTNSDIYVFDLGDKSTENITMGMQGYDKYPVFSNDGKQIAWQSMETPGYEADIERLFVMDLETGQKKYLTEGFDQDVASMCWSNDNSKIYFISGIEATYQVYSINVDSRKIVQITEGVHDYTSINLGNDFLTGAKMSMSNATEIFRIDLPSGNETQISFVNQHIYDNIEMGRVEERWIKTTNNKDMKVWVIYPPNFDPEKQYPALLYCQGGPQSAVSQFFSYRWNFQIMAANDYIIVAPNRHGLPTFGSEWNEQISGDYGGQNMKDYLSAIDAVKEEPYVDETRMGAVGASYGGYSVFYLAGHHEGRFKAFISHCGIFNFESMYAATEEMFFVNHDLGGPFWEKPQPKSYKFSPHLYVDRWDTPIMIITGENDFRIPYTQSLQAFNAAQLMGVPSKLLVFPGETHFVLKPQNAILWQREFFGWLDKYLK